MNTKNYKKMLKKHINKQSEQIKYLWRTPASVLITRISDWERTNNIKEEE